MEADQSQIALSLEAKSWAGATADELSTLLALFAGYSVIIEGQAGSGKNRIVGRYLLAKSVSARQIDIVGRPITTLCPARYLNINELGVEDEPASPIDILWVDEANLHDLTALKRCHQRYSQIILTYSSDQGFALGEDLADALRDKPLYAVRLQQNVRSTRSARATLKDIIEDAPVYEPGYGSIERRSINLTTAEEDSFSTALAIHMIALRYANAGSPMVVVAQRPATITFLRELGKQIPSPLMEIVHPDKLQGNDGSVFIYPTAEASARSLDLFDLEILATRAKRKTHIIVQGASGAVFADPEFIHAPFRPDMSRFFRHVQERGFIAEPRRHSIMLYHSTTFTSALLLIIYDSAAAPRDIHECRRLLLAALSRKTPAAAVPIEVVLNDYFRNDDPRLVAALRTAVTPNIGNRHGDFFGRYSTPAPDLRTLPGRSGASS